MFLPLLIYLFFIYLLLYSFVDRVVNIIIFMLDILYHIYIFSLYVVYLIPVSYTHLDVYKRQGLTSATSIRIIVMIKLLKNNVIKLVLIKYKHHNLGVGGAKLCLGPVRLKGLGRPWAHRWCRQKFDAKRRIILTQCPLTFHEVILIFAKTCSVVNTESIFTNFLNIACFYWFKR